MKKKPKGNGHIFRIMRVTGIQLMVGIMLSGLAIAHDNRAQAVLDREVSLHLIEVPFSEALNNIGAAANVRFVYSPNHLKADERISLEASKLKLKQVLHELLARHQLKFSVEQDGDYILITPAMDAENYSTLATPAVLSREETLFRVTGRVTDSKGIGMAGVNIVIKGTGEGVSTNADGNFAIDVKQGQVLLFSFIGYKGREVQIEGQTVVDVVMVEDMTTLQEVEITTAYGIERKAKEIGYTVTKVNGEEISKANSGNILTGLIGKVAGLSITTQSSDMSPQMRILLRGVRSFGANTNNQPLFVLNGAPLSFGNDQNAAAQTMEFINNFNPSDIEDVTVLKGANATALYGPEGVNGVIVITTKKAAKGLPVINFRNNTSVQIVDFRKDFRQQTYGIGSGQVDEFGNGIYDPKGISNWGPAYDGSLVPIGYPDENGEMQMVTYSYKKDARRFFDAAITNRSNLSFSQADATSSYYLGLGYLTQTGLLPGDKQNQLNVLLTSSKKFGNLINIQTNFNYSRLNSNRGRSVEAGVRNLPTFIPLLSYKDWRNGYWANRNRYWQGISPYETLDNNRTKSTANSLSGSLTFTINPVDWLTITERPSINYTSNYSKATSAQVKFADFTTDPQKFYDVNPTTAEFMLSNTSVNNDFILSTVHKAGDFIIRTNVGNTIRQNYIKQIQAAATLAGEVYNLDFHVIPVQASEAAVLSRTTSAFARVSAGYKDMIFLELTGRNEWDSKRAKVARGKDFYSSANTSLVLKEMLPALKNLNWLSSARLRASFAKSANMNIIPYQSERILILNSGYPFLNADQSGYVFGYSFVPDINPNPLLKPENVFSQEYGMSLGFNNIITADITYYYQVNKSVILNVANAWLSGYPTTDNAGEFENHGWEVELTLNPVALAKDFTFSARVTAAINDNEVLSLTPIYKGQFPVQDPSGQKYFARPGHSAYEYAITDWKRDPQGRVVVDKNSGFPIETGFEEYDITGNTLPRYSTSAALNFSWRRFSASMLFDYVGGYDHMFATSLDFYLGTDPRTTYNNRQPYVFPNSVYEDDAGNYVENTDIPVESAGQELYTKHSTRNAYGLSSGSFCKLRELAFQYDLPIKSTSLKSLSFILYGRDLFTMYPKSNVYGDPGLVRGPGFRELLSAGSVNNGLTSVGNNATGGSSDESALPGTVQFGITISATF